MIKNKRAIEPIIATVLLIVIAIALFLLIFLWIRSFQAERVEKFGAPIENACKNVELGFSVSESQLEIRNDGNVPVYKVQLFEVTSKGTEELGTPQKIDILAGGKTTLGISSCTDRLKIVPILLGKTEKGAEKEYICKDKSFTVSCS